ncbi:MAG TPA: phosphoribosylglycinamide formyltransferase [Chitinophagaceae bacterium]|nr:phosphoribosylglycinamide formyltransferase [Chitinophagaceae bacterium]
MFKQLQQKWKVSSLQLAIVLITFAIGGSLTGYIGRKLMNVFSIGNAWLWFITYIILIILLWPLMVLVVSIPFGKFRFFLHYIRKIGMRMHLIKSTKSINMTNSSEIRLAIFASGAGSNAQKIIDYFRNHAVVKIALIVCNKPEAGVLKIAAKENIPTLMIEKEKFFRGNGYVNELKQHKINWIILAGFLWKIPDLLINAFPEKIVNIHPALLPKYGGKGMYGQKVHEAVLANHEKESGITIHYVDNLYDHGKVIFQAKCDVLPDDTAENLAQRIHVLEHEHYPVAIEQLVSKKNHLL